MSEAQKILEMIESVDPNDTDTLNEIDARAWCFVRKPDHQFCGIEIDKTGFRIKAPDQFEETIKYSDFKHVSNKHSNGCDFTRSRDRLKTIRPEGWGFICSPDNCTAIHKHTGLEFALCAGKSEELAELHAIIQAIEWERNHE